MGKLDGKVALITGSGRNIGRATALKLAGEGAHIVVNARTNQAEADAVAHEVRDRGVKAISILADLAKKDQVDTLAARALSEFGRVDILINNAAIRPHKPFTEVTVQDWEHVRGVVLDGAFYLTQAVIPSMVKNGYGRILFFCGEGAFTGGSGRAHVSAAKTGPGRGGAVAGFRVHRPEHPPQRGLPAAASIPGGTIPNGIGGMCRVRPASRSAGKGMSTKSPPPACFWSATTARSSPTKPYT